MNKPAAAGRSRQLALGVGCMVMIANLQYGWTLFVGPICAKFGWPRAAVQGAFTIFVFTQTWLVPLEGYLIDRFGPRVTVFWGGLLAGLGWVMNARAATLTQFYAAAAVGGIGAGIVLGAAYGNALKWFPDRRGLATGLTAAGFGAGSALTIVPIARLIQSGGYETAFLRFGLLQGAAVMLLALGLKAPPAAPHGARHPLEAPGAAPGAVLRSPVFWVLYAMFVMVASGGLMATAQLALIARDFNVADASVSLLGLTLPALMFALSLDRVLNGLARPFFGWVSDWIGREETMFAAFSLEGIAILLLMRCAANPLLFVVFSGLTFFAWGEIYSLFPAISGDEFGPRFATANYGMLYTAKGAAALLVPLANVLSDQRGWSAVFIAAAALDFAAAFLALFVLRSMRRRRAPRYGLIASR